MIIGLRRPLSPPAKMETMFLKALILIVLIVLIVLSMRIQIYQLIYQLKRNLQPKKM